MGRKPRVEFRGATYHVFARGNRREKIFHDDQDYAAYVEDLKIISAKAGVDVLAYCLMPNHPHLCLRTNDTPLSQFMHRMNTRHARRFNLKYATRGHLHEGRYRAILVDAELYLLRLARYIHQNPLRAGLTQTLEEWPYSSYQLYLEPRAWIDCRPVLQRLGGVANFEAFMKASADAEDHELFAAARRGFIMAGSPEFAFEVRARMSASGAELARWRPRRPAVVIAPIETEAARWLEQMHPEIELWQVALASRREPLQMTRRRLAAHLVAVGYSQAEIGRLFGRDSAAISRLLSRQEPAANDKNDRSGTLRKSGTSDA